MRNNKFLKGTPSAVCCYDSPRKLLQGSSILFIIMNIQILGQPQKGTELTEDWPKGKLSGRHVYKELRAQVCTGKTMVILSLPCGLSLQVTAQPPPSVPFLKLWGWKAPGARLGGSKPRGWLAREEASGKTQIIHTCGCLVRYLNLEKKIVVLQKSVLRIISSGLAWWLSGNESAYQCRRFGFDPWVGKILWRRKW